MAVKSWICCFKEMATDSEATVMYVANRQAVIFTCRYATAQDGTCASEHEGKKVQSFSQGLRVGALSTLCWTTILPTIQ